MSLPQLRVRTEYTFRRAYGPVGEVAARLDSIGASAAGIVDYDGTWGHINWSKSVDNPLYGVELPLPQENGHRPTFWMLGEEFGALYRATSFPPTTLAEVTELKGVVRFAGAALTDPAAIDYVDINPRSRRRTVAALELARRIGKPIVVTSDNDYPGPEHRERFLAWDDSLKMTPQHIMTPDELRAAFPMVDDGLWRQIVKNTHEAAERCAGLKPAVAPIISVAGDFRSLVERGREYRMAHGHIKAWTPEYQQRLEREMTLIAQKEFESYFVVVADMITWAKERMLVGPGRGSSAGSLVCYLLRITEVDPLVHGLIFERFIDVNRADLPDIDVDFNDQKREQVFEYLADKYGRENTARIGSVNRLKPRSVLAHVGKKLGIPHGATFNVINVLIEHSSGDARYGHSLEETMEQTQPGRDFAAKYPESDVMWHLENHASHTGVHAAGFIVCNEPITNFCAVRNGVAQIDKKDSEALNLLKIDVLGLRTLGVIEDADCITPDQLYDLSLDDPEVFSVFNDHKFSGLFQFEGAAQRRVATQIPVAEFSHIDYITALSRPGPLGGGAANTYIKRYHGQEDVAYRHPSMANYLADTLGVVLYQEQVMRIVRELGQFSWEETSTIRKAMSGRKGQEFFDSRGDAFVKGAAAGAGIPEDEAREIWSQIVSFGAWGMNKCTHKDTRVKLAHPNQTLGSDPTIEELYQAYKAAPSSWNRHRMPVLLCVGADGVAKPTKAVDIVYTGAKSCWRYTFDDGRNVECTPDHKFIVNGRWLPIGQAVIGDEVAAVARDHSARQPLKGRPTGKKNGRMVAERSFKERMRGQPCEDCGEQKRRMEVHHNDHAHGAKDKDDLAWLCSSCHKLRHKAAGDWADPYARGWLPATPAKLVSAESTGTHDTYDIEMPHPNHNYVLANGIVTHNSHTVSYSIISYWCAYMKRYHALEYAAALLRNAKDDDQTIETLRELNAEGIGFTAFDANRSEVNWSVKDGRLVGGYTNLVGIGPVKAAQYVERRNAGQLTEKDCDALAARVVKHNDLRPAHTKWDDIYRHPENYNINGRVKEFGELEDQENAVVVARLVRLDRRDENESVRANRRGYLKKGNTLFLDCFMVDDSVTKPVLVRLRPRMWFTHGVKMADRSVPGQDWFLIRGRWLAQFTMMTVDKIKCLTNERMFE